VDTAILDALAGFYRDQHTLITDAITDAQRQHQAAHADRHAELATVDAELTKTGQAIDRYLAAFERGTINEELVTERLIELRDKTKQLRLRHDELTLTLDDHPTAPSLTTLTEITNHITKIINTGSANQRKTPSSRRSSPTSPSPHPTGSSPSSASPNPTPPTGPQLPHQRKRPRKERFAQ
jgi:site-specific DNA recombinase